MQILFIYKEHARFMQGSLTLYPYPVSLRQCMKRLLLSCVGLEMTRSRDSIASFLSKTLLHVQREKLGVDVLAFADEAIQVEGDV